MGTGNDSHDCNAAFDSEPLAVIRRTRERAERVLRNNSSNTAKALAKDALELCAIIDDFRAELREPTVLSQIRRKLGV